MATAIRIADQEREARPLIAEEDYSRCTLRELLKARYWLDADRSPDKGVSIEQEIQNRCVLFKNINERQSSATSGVRKRYRPYGLMLGVFFLLLSSGPYLAVEFLDTVKLVPDVNGDHGLLSGVWAVLTLPFAVLVVLIGGITDAERVVKWLHL